MAPPPRGSQHHWKLFRNRSGHLPLPQSLHSPKAPKPHIIGGIPSVAPPVVRPPLPGMYLAP